MYACMGVFVCVCMCGVSMHMHMFVCECVCGMCMYVHLYGTCVSVGYLCGVSVCVCMSVNMCDMWCV